MSIYYLSKAVWITKICSFAFQFDTGIWKQISRFLGKQYFVLFQLHFQFPGTCYLPFPFVFILLFFEWRSVEAGSQPVGVSSLLPFWGMNSGGQPRQEEPLPTEPSGQPRRPLLIFRWSLPRNKCSRLHNHASFMPLLFRSTYICEQLFSRMKQ